MHQIHAHQGIEGNERAEETAKEATGWRPNQPADNVQMPRDPPECQRNTGNDPGARAIVDGIWIESHAASSFKLFLQIFPETRRVLRFL
ncbi:hypothetical protein BDV36DRAFT_28840 [Aspergillus pseudocaelatus]|uniref:RNase H type-1 domain-containing protein n=1 Tax=Aspergillus pseudocaelatus TaxID=1825620 RepID=A0ABQ6WBM2_9EURO|nr:hypothetical protein BDV36DRAFT_28840 [Aspergillus pseudocaelatus]